MNINTTLVEVGRLDESKTRGLLIGSLRTRITGVFALVTMTQLSGKLRGIKVKLIPPRPTLITYTTMPGTSGTSRVDLLAVVSG